MLQILVITNKNLQKNKNFLKIMLITCLKCNKIILVVYYDMLLLNFKGEPVVDGLKNIMEDDVERLLNDLLPTMPNVCNCEICKADMAAYALNRLKPNYVRSNKGELFHKVNNSSIQAKTDLMSVVITAINTIGARPSHD